MIEVAVIILERKIIAKPGKPETSAEGAVC